MDIGPYEHSGKKFITTLLNSRNDNTLSDNDLMAFDPTVLGVDLDYTWQRSTDNNTWSTLPASSFDANTLIAPSEAYYRLITQQKEYNVIDTYGTTQLSILEAPQPNLGEAEYIDNENKVWLKPAI